LCPPPDGMSGTVFARRVRDLALKYSRSVFPFKAYCSSPLDETLRSELRDSHVIVLEEKQETVDKLRRAVEMLGFAMDQAPRVPGTVIFISSDVDFACVLSELRNRGHFVGLLCPEDTADSTLKGHASHVFGWNKVFRFGEDEEQISQDDSLINLDADAPSPPNQPDWARLPSSPPRALSSSTYAELRTIQHPILNDDSPRQDSGPNSPVRTRVEANASPSNQVTPPAPSDQPLYSISAFADLITALEEENREANAEEHICSKIADRIRTINPEFLIQPQLQSRLVLDVLLK
ncbi:hypothetical protein FRB90_005146, partial [Tulasnella sp. 427]